MGKQRRQRHKPHKANPTGLPSVKELELTEEFTEGNREKVLQNAYGDIQSSNLEEKLSALQILASMSCDSSMAKQIAKDGIAKIIGPLLMDHNAAIRANTVYTLRDIAENGGEDAYTDLINDDIMTPLTALLKQHLDWEPKKTRDEKETFVQAVDLLRILCANNESALKCVNREDLVSLLTKFLDIKIYGMKIVTITTQCMVCLSDENDIAIKKIKQSESILFNLLDLKIDDEKTAFKVLALRTSVADLLININNDIDSNQMQVFCKVLPILSEVLTVDHKQLLSCLISILPHENNISNEKRKKIQENRKMLELQEQALQILTNLCYEDDDSEIDSEIDESDVMEIESECLDDDSMNDTLKMTSTFPVELVEIINNCNLIDKIWNKTELVVDKDSQEILTQTTEGKAVVKQFQNIRCAAYLCLNNLLSSIEIDVFGGVDNLYRKWLEIGTAVFKSYDTSSNVELLEAATAAMRAILQQLAEVRATVFKQLTVQDFQPLLNCARQCPNASVRVNLIRMLCNLVQILMNNKNSENHEMIKFISTFLLDICTTDTQAWVIAESIDALMDIYAEDETDCLATEINLVLRLSSLTPHFKSKVRQQKKQLKDNMSVISIVNANLTRFIKYKQRQIRNLNQMS
ncbi:HEAT repeat-containing protein 3 [Anoplolepis gracilipes]|uniref:HEAT repeat-containing protein 3 n=1 Tax=Anoplolepis gracilipes TaxID=354296 RepID=UPI003BA09163